MTTRPTESFAGWLGQYGKGNLDDRLTAGLAEVSQAVKLLEKEGVVTLQLKVKSGPGGGVVVVPSVNIKVPEGKVSGEFYFVLDDGTLSRRDPSQPQLPAPVGDVDD